jgi:hypothetical protein
LVSSRLVSCPSLAPYEHKTGVIPRAYRWESRRIRRDRHDSHRDYPAGVTWTSLIPAGMQESRRGFTIANNAGTVIPTGMQESRRFFPVVIHAEVGIPPGSSLHFHPSHSTTRHALLQKSRNLFLLASFQLLSNWQQNASTIYTQSPDVGELENSSNGYSTTMLVCSTSVHQHV